MTDKADLLEVSASDLRRAVGTSQGRAFVAGALSGTALSFFLVRRISTLALAGVAAGLSYVGYRWVQSGGLNLGGSQ